MPTYNVPNIVALLRIVSELCKNRMLVMQQLRNYVEKNLEEKSLGGSSKWFCARATFEKYVKLSVEATFPVQSPSHQFRNVMKSIQAPAFEQIVDYIELVSPGATSDL